MTQRSALCLSRLTAGRLFPAATIVEGSLVQHMVRIGQLWLHSTRPDTLVSDVFLRFPFTTILPSYCTVPVAVVIESS